MRGRRCYAYAWASGLIEFGPSVPSGALPIIRGGRRAMDLVRVRARHAYDGESLLVPGVPEADSEAAAVDALTAFCRLVSSDLRGRA